MTGLKVGLIGTALSSVSIPVLGDFSVPASPDGIAGKDANYILATVCVVLAFAVWQIAKLYITSQKTMMDMNSKNIEALTKVADAIAHNTSVLERCQQRGMRE